MPAVILPAASPDALAAATRAQRLRVAAHTAVDPFARDCWTPAPAYAAGAAYPAGAVVSANGSLYVAVNGATTPASPNPPSHANGSAVSDGAVLWTWLGPAPVAATDPLAPTVSVATTAPALGNVHGVIGAATTAVPGAFRAIGGYVYDYGGYAGLYTLQRAAGVSVGQHAGWEFETDEAQVCVTIFGKSQPVQLVIDGRRWSPGGVTLIAGGDNFVTVGFPGQERRARRIRVELGNTAMALRDVRVAATGQIWSPARDYLRAVFISDSIMAGSSFGPFVAGGSVPQRVGAALGWSDPWNFSIGGTGYIAGGANYTYGQRVAEALTRNPEMWVFMGSTNDSGQPAAAITSAALAAFRAVRAGGSAAPILVLGVWPKDAAAAVTEAAVKAAFDAFADPASAWIPIAADPSGMPWITGAWNNAGHPGSANAGQWIGGDGTHPTDGGSAYLARRIVRAIRAGVLDRL